MQALQFPTPSESIPEPPPVTDLGQITVPPSRWKTLLARRATRVGAVVLLVGLLAAIMFAGLMRTPGTTVQADAIAELFVRAYLTEAGEGTEQTLQPFLGFSPNLDGMVSGSWYVTDTTSVDTSQEGGTRRVTVAADTYGRVDGGFGDHEIQYFEVTLERSAQGYRATSLPSRVAGPILGQFENEPELQLAATLPESAVHAVTDYLVWYLTGIDGPYPESRPTTQYVSVDVLAVQEVGTGTIAHITATDTADRTLPMAYPVSVEFKDGRWLVGMR